MAFDATDFIPALPAPVIQNANLLAVRDLIARLPDRLFDYSESWPAEWHEPGASSPFKCSTPVCILGWARTLSPTPYREEIAPWMGLTEEQARDLFFGAPQPFSQISRRDAVAVLDHLIRTGEVDWSVARKVKAS